MGAKSCRRPGFIERRDLHIHTDLSKTVCCSQLQLPLFTTNAQHVKLKEQSHLLPPFPNAAFRFAKPVPCPQSYMQTDFCIFVLNVIPKTWFNRFKSWIAVINQWSCILCLCRPQFPFHSTTCAPCGHKSISKWLLSSVLQQVRRSGLMFTHLSAPLERKTLTT